MAARAFCLLAAPLALHADALWSDDVSLVQVRSAEAAAPVSGSSALSVQSLLQRFSSAWPPDKQASKEVNKPGTRTTFNCSEVPGFCSAPFSCGGPHKKTAANGHATATADLHANLQSWCGLYPTFSKPMTACAAGKLEQYGRWMFDEQKATSTGPLRPNITNVDAQYCFLFGHCNNTEPVGQTVEEMEQMCDKRFGGREQWTSKFHVKSGIGGVVLGGIADGSIHGQPFHPMQVTVSRSFATAFAKQACAMGNYHCDVVYCREMYCKDPAWSAKYAHLAPRKRLPGAPRRTAAGKADGAVHAPEVH